MYLTEIFCFCPRFEKVLLHARYLLVDTMIVVQQDLHQLPLQPDTCGLDLLRISPLLILDLVLRGLLPMVYSVEDIIFILNHIQPHI